MDDFNTFHKLLQNFFVILPKKRDIADIFHHTRWFTLREKCPNTEFFWSVFSHIRTISPYSVRKRENTDQKKLHIWTLFMQCQRVSYSNFSSDLLVNVTDSNYYGIVIVSLFYLKYIWWCWNMMFYKTHSARSIKLSVDAILSVLFWKAFLIATKPSLWDRLYIYI